MTSPPLSPEWSALAGRVVAEYRAALGDDLVAIALFGSVARGRARPDSDLDLYVVTRRPSLGDSRLHGMWDRIDASPEYQALVRAGYQPTPSPVPPVRSRVRPRAGAGRRAPTHGRAGLHARRAAGRELVLGPQARLASRRGRRPVTNGERADRLVGEARQIAGEMKTHDPAPVFAHAVRTRGVDVDAGVLDSLTALSQELAKIRSPAFYQETLVTQAQARDWVQRVERALHFGEDLLRRLRKVL